MAIVTGVKFQSPGKVYYFAPGENEIADNDHVIVETTRGVEYGTVIFANKEIGDDEIKQPLKEIIRKASEKDEKKNTENKEKEQEAFDICKKKIAEHELEMKLVGSEYTFDRGKLLFYFTADKRIDFRELVKDLASVFRTRIELRQVGVRDETKLIGGIGSCGRPLCCHTFLNEFAPVSIKMAKEQNLSLNQTKISGTCGRLMCCLKNEQDTYEYLNAGLPNKGKDITTPEGLKGVVQNVNILRQMVNVVVDLDNDEKELRSYHISELNGEAKKQEKQKEDEIEHFFDQYIGADRDAEDEPDIYEAPNSDDKVKKDGETDNVKSENSDLNDGDKKSHKRRRRRRHRRRSGGENENKNSGNDSK